MDKLLQYLISMGVPAQTAVQTIQKLTGPAQAQAQVLQQAQSPRGDAMQADLQARQALYGMAPQPQSPQASMNERQQLYGMAPQPPSPQQDMAQRQSQYLAPQFPPGAMEQAHRTFTSNRAASPDPVRGPMGGRASTMGPRNAPSPAPTDRVKEFLMTDPQKAYKVLMDHLTNSKETK